MAELVLSAFLGVLFEKLASAALKNIASYKGVDAEIKKWQRSLKQIQAVLTDASRKEITNESVKQWLNDLQHLAYDIDDVLDDLATEAMHREFTHDSEAITSKVRKLIPTCCTNFSQSTRMHAKLDKITTKLQDLVEEKATLGLRVEGETKKKNKNRELQTSVVDASSIVGRQVEEEALVSQLLADEPCDQNFSIVPIVGMGGVGKTTLATLLYNNQQVTDHFELKAWVCVSDDFDSFGISKVIFESVAQENKKFEDFNLLQIALRDQLRGKRFLLVLDDVWSEKYEDWKTLVGPFHACAPGSKVVITTRKEQLLNKLGYNRLNKLQCLSHDDAMSLFALNALGVNKFNSHLSLKPHAEGIVKKCDGLPLALISLGRSLRTKQDEESWREVLESEIWMSKDDAIVPALRLSYSDLSASLKQLFAYCSLFPKDFMFGKEELVLLWAAEGFLHRSTPIDATKERLGRECFNELLSRSFFQPAPNNESFFVMHDLMNDLATSVASEFFVRLENDMKRNIRKEMLEKYRHMSFTREEYVTYKKFETFKIAKSLRTFLATFDGVKESWQDFYLSSKILIDLLPELPMLRVLSLSGFCIREVPQTIGSLRHLRYLNLSRTEVTHLPENVCNLYNLETLIVRGCYSLAKLPNNFLKLKNLRHLDIRGTPLLNQMPFGICELKSLQTLSKIVIGGERGFQITKLKEFTNLCGKICIEGLDKVQNAIHVREANFSQKRLSELEVVWSDEPYDSRNEMLEKEVLNELEPRNDKLIQLIIRSYGGLEFPDWVGNPLFLHLKHVSLRDCKRCTSLPPLGQLPLLKELFIEGLDEVEAVGLEFLGTSRAFSSLEILSFKHMHEWKKWSTSRGVVFPSLNVLKICDCPSLVEVTLETLPSVNVLEITKCDSGLLRRLIEIASAVTKLNIESITGLNDVVWRGVIRYLGAVEELQIWMCSEIRHLWESEVVASKVLVKLRRLDVFLCDNLVSLGETEEEDNCRSNLWTSVRNLKVSNCRNMERLICPDSIQVLSLWGCKSVTVLSFPKEGQKLKTVDIWDCNELLEREWGGQNMNNNNRSSMPMLENILIEGWTNLKSIKNLNYLVHLTKLSIVNCENLESFPDNELSDLTLLKDLRIIDCPSMDASFPCGIWPPKLQSLGIGMLKKSISDWTPQNFPTSLAELILVGDDGVNSCSQFSHLLPSSLTSLHIHRFEKLESLSMGLQHLQCLSFDNCPNLNKLSHPHPQNLTSLQHLYFSNCANMMDLPEVLLPSLLRLEISDCPGLKERCSKRGCYWPLVSHIPCLKLR
ncbi:putative virus X resistance protein-like, coiled-coil [Helianthus annuus]|uniref:Virus X resistance protein-like, coiled-coil n=1 Tax=Helianthus annuus TaxID=4232 RepID=A0A9K3HBT0_HELAN|nr:putative disease resistance RPP13-like protein 1 [Helianthus annuus]XP_022002244.1 putative disease resistance RPP13-like protein 1 [Helianthus annuus]KAF5774927.1 putative virus X resistance protein-like, coiled-coil [Helianthus annuus]KAJ0478168.1 putative virus X resistance protein-like, coiled-coil [Helianthus annuus]KAJ0499051.1 putative virus X resistance protein-like, coiled-coil [Helianthus annuus]KAJ0665065.1 putative virus X resistance protein-like, coiled-coil [Helianthus annuus]